MEDKDLLIIKERNKLWDDPKLEKIKIDMKNQIEKRIKVHSHLSTTYKTINYIVGIPSTLISATVTTGIISTFKNCSSEGCNNEWIRLSFGIIGLTSIVLSSIQTFLNPQSISEKHKSAVDSYDILLLDLDRIYNLPILYRGDPIKFFENIHNRYNELIKTSPHISLKNYLLKEELLSILEKGILSNENNYDVKTLEFLLDTPHEDSI